MVIYEDYGTNKEGTPLTRAYSDAGMYIDRDGAMYDEAVDPTELGRVYTETDIPIAENEEAAPEDYEAALNEVGVEL